MKFHSVHGTAITLTENKSVATRSDNDFGNGIVFGDKPIKQGQKVCIEVTCTSNWSGALRIGLVSHDPSKQTPKNLPKFALPFLAKREGFYIRAVRESLICTGSRLTFYINNNNQLQLFINNEHKGALLTNIPTDKALWLLLDVYGNTTSVRFVNPGDAPKEIFARGPDAIQAFEQACISGVQPVHRTRLMIIGQDQIEKTSLKKALLGLRHNDVQERTDGIDLFSSCSFSKEDSNKCHMVIKDDDIDESKVNNDPDKLGVLGGPEGLEEEYHQAIASNIVQELIYQQRQRTSSTTKPTGVLQKLKSGQTPGQTGSRTSVRSSASSIRNIGKASISVPMFTDIPSEAFNDVPERVIQIVQNMLEQRSEVKDSDQKSVDSYEETNKSQQKQKVVLNIWDFSGEDVYCTTHQVFLTSRAVYIIVFNLCEDLLKPHEDLNSKTDGHSELSPLDYMDFWMRTVYIHASEITENAADNKAISPLIFIVGTQRNGLHPDPDVREQLVQEKFAQIREFITSKPYVQHLITPFYAVEYRQDGGDEQIDILHHQIKVVASREPYMGEHLPCQWLQFELEISKQVEEGKNYASYDQVIELAANLGITDYSEVSTMLDFYHDLGVIIYFGRGYSNLDSLLCNTVILNPKWLIEMFKRVISKRQNINQWDLLVDKWQKLEKYGILEEVLLDSLWQDAKDQKLVLLGLMEKLDIIGHCLLTVSELDNGGKNKTYFVPSRFSSCTDTKMLYTKGPNDVVFYIDFHGFLPVILFHRLLMRTVHWTQEYGRHDPYCIYEYIAHYYLDSEHDFILEMMNKQYHLMKVVILRVSECDDDSVYHVDKILSQPGPQACARIRNFLESCLTDLRETWMKRISYTICIACPCNKTCSLHNQQNCPEESCLHFLKLDECLINRVVCCEHRRVKTASFKKWFPEPLTKQFSTPVLPPISLSHCSGNIEKHCHNIPSWLKTSAKLLNGGDEKSGWEALAKELGYKQNRINLFNDDYNPSLALLMDWIISSGNTCLALDMLSVYLEKINRDDIVEVIQKARQVEDPAQVFISYQWDHQDEAKTLRNKLEQAGFSCWMDVGQMGGGDALNIKIDEGMRNAKVVIACVSPKYVVSHHCTREIGLADLLRKPIIPVLMEKTAWPPPGGMALILSQLVYINMKGVGGHGGSGIHADLEDKYNEIIQCVSLYAAPNFSHFSDTESETDEKQALLLIDQTSNVDSDYSMFDVPLYQNQYSNNNVLIPENPVQRRDGPDVGTRPYSVPETSVTQCVMCIIL
ncbi:hypothetical protein CHS0354_033622 [Potamilus streckersoni]|uniref:Uncharacterized protein n=1 Tax=Potamilus streckersoni TaxID=2493646 RepID=A0AAE0SS19_9BIVA|nr:hypothetical protein CHS0354_033622 [Potamilus streckersoni]